MADKEKTEPKEPKEPKAAAPSAPAPAEDDLFALKLDASETSPPPDRLAVMETIANAETAAAAAHFVPEAAE